MIICDLIKQNKTYVDPDPKYTIRKVIAHLYAFETLFEHIHASTAKVLLFNTI